jgi:hypothetical protein
MGILTLLLWPTVLLSPFLLTGSMAATGGWSAFALRANQTDEQPPESMPSYE